ncbi:hypothetical protein [Spiroplasma turonicum]|uniref:Uncharacterized protein n=1 Tax=Spiroplasma turonicum TaxID=216946 RepID=A0A0K1P696_9MOLU|nr:hypothetical protein [Spiroplasma turonicum]AKU79709.1 hypothetical protein STURON_00463 [Spiroplasma turonicum]ALX70727.1 hypothetical protein STURO_v1c04610 [Spiroplasma turonicum]
MKKKNSLLKDYKKTIKNYIKFLPLNFFVYILDLLVFASLVSIFITNRLVEIESLSWVIISLCLYTIFRFSFLNWFQKNKYYKKILVYDFQGKVGDGDMVLKREVSYNSISFWVVLIVINLSTAVIVNYEVSTFLTNQKYMLAITNTSLNMLLLPSFLSSFQQIGQIDKSVASNYINLVKDQYFSNKDLFENCEFEDNYLNLKFTKSDLTSKNGLFIFVDKDIFNQADIAELYEINKTILNTYKNIWENYYTFLKKKNEIKVSKVKLQTQYWIERIYDHIFIDFFNV